MRKQKDILPIQRIIKKLITKKEVQEKSSSDPFPCGKLSSEDIKNCRKELRDIVIAPFNAEHAKGVGYNFSLSEMIYSTRKKRLTTIHHSNDSTYFYIAPHDTVLALSYEYLKISKNISGDFHSRVRHSAQGLGNISTTLDPGWTGMLLFSLNNPTKKRIKITLATSRNGQIETNPVITLATFRTKCDHTKSNVDLGLDNPPMRTDIWNETSQKPYRFLGYKKYEEFQKLVKYLLENVYKPSEKVSWVDNLSEDLNNLKIAIQADKSNKKIHAMLIKIASYKNLPKEVCEKVNSLTEELSKTNKTTNIYICCSDEKYLQKIDLLDKEIQYQKLCDQVSQIHVEIDKHVPHRWKNMFLANLGHFFRKNAFVILATIISATLLVYGFVKPSDSLNTNLINLFAAIVPLITSIIASIFDSIKPTYKQNEER